MPRSFLVLVLGLALALVAGCPSEDNSGTGTNSHPDDGFSGTCGTSRGVDDLWKMSHGQVPNIDQIPVPGGDWVLYSEPTFPLLGFMYPPNWNATRIYDASDLGVQLVRNDGNAMFLRVYVVYPRADLTPQQIVDAEETQLVPSGVTPTLLCQDAGDTVTSVGQRYQLEAIQAGDQILFISANTVYDPGNLGYGAGTTLQAALDIFVAPAAEFTQVTENVFLAIIYQMLYTDSGGQEDDTDGDGYVDSVDAFPYDASRH